MTANNHNDLRKRLTMVVGRFAFIFSDGKLHNNNLCMCRCTKIRNSKHS